MAHDNVKRLKVDLTHLLGIKTSLPVGKGHHNVCVGDNQVGQWVGWGEVYPCLGGR